MPRPTPITDSDGNEYPSNAAMARAKGVSPSALAHAKRRGTLHNVGSGVNAGVPFYDDKGNLWPSRSALCRAKGLDPRTMRARERREAEAAEASKEPWE